MTPVRGPYPPGLKPGTMGALAYDAQRRKFILPKKYVVICRADRTADDKPGEYVCATHRLFDAEQAAAYAMTVAQSREPRIVEATEYLKICERFRDEDDRPPPPQGRKLVDVEVPL